MDVPLRIRQSLAISLVVFAAVEVIAAVHALLVNPLSAHTGSAASASGSAITAFATAIVAASAAVWVIEPMQSPVNRLRIASIATVCAYAAVLAGLVPLLTPFLLPNFLFAHDGGVHQTYAYLFDRAVHQGQLPVRWVEGLGYGKGQPLFNYYQVGFYYLVELIHLIVPRLSISVKLAIVAVWAAGTGFTYLWLRPSGRLPSLLAAAVFAWSPYLMVDGYVRTAYPELMAVCLIPAVFWSLDQLLRTGRPLFVCALALATALLIVSHLPTALIVAPICGAYLLAGSVVRPANMRHSSLIVVAVAVGIGLSAFYALPSILELDAIRIRGMTTGYRDFHLHFVHPAAWFDWTWGYAPSGSGESGQVSTQIGVVQWVVIAAAFAGVTASSPRFPRRLAFVGWLAVVIYALFMMTAASVGIWDRVAPLAFIQFPWRFLMLPTVACSALAALALALVPNRTAQALIVICAVALQWSITQTYWGQAWGRERAAIAIDAPDWWVSRNASMWGFREAAYDPKGVTAPPPLAVERWKTVGGRSEVTPLSLTDTRVELRVAVTETTALIVCSPFFPGWQVSLDGRRVTPTLLPDTAYMEVDLPPGSHRVDATFGNTRLRATANWVSAASLLLWLVIAGWSLFGGAYTAPRK